MVIVLIAFVFALATITWKEQSDDSSENQLNFLSILVGKIYAGVY